MITVKQGDALNAFYAIRPLMRQRMPKQKALELYNLRLILQKQFDFQVEQEQNIIQELEKATLELGSTVSEKPISEEMMSPEEGSSEAAPAPKEPKRV